MRAIKESIQQKEWNFEWIVLAYVILATLSGYGFNLTTNNLYNQVPVIQSWLDPSLYQQDFYIQEMQGFTPRIFYYALIFLPVKMGADLNMVFFAYYFSAFASIVLGVRKISKLFNHSEFAFATLFFLFLSSGNGTIGDVSLLRQEPISAVYAIGIAIWGIYFCLNDQWKQGYLVFGIACLVQFILGILPAALFFPVLCSRTLPKRQYRRLLIPCVIIIIFASFIYIPMKLLGNTSTELISNQEFIDIYGFIRHPHHIIYSSFGLRNWLRFFAFLFGTFLSLRLSRSLSKKVKTEFFLLLFSASIILIIGYIFVEIFPVSFIAKLQLARVTPFIKIFSLIILNEVLQEAYVREKNWPLFFFGLMAIVIEGGPYLIPVFLILFNISKNSREINKYESFACAIFGLIFFINTSAGIYILIPFMIQARLCLYLVGKSSQNPKDFNLSPATLLSSLFVFALALVLYRHTRLYRFILIFSPFLINAIISSKVFRNIFYSLVSLLIAIFLLLGFFHALPGPALSAFETSFKLPQNVSSDEIDIARRFKESSPLDALVLVPPRDTSFRFFSERSLVFSFKSFPFTDEGILEWFRRYNSILGSSSSGVDRAYQRKSAEELSDLANQFGATYILTRQSWHSDIRGGHLHDSEGDWAIWSLDSNE